MPHSALTEVDYSFCCSGFAKWIWAWSWHEISLSFMGE